MLSNPNFNYKKKQFDKRRYYPTISIDENRKIIYLLFNSNVKGKLGCGYIGRNQLIKMWSKIDGIKELKKYKLIAVLHHHIAKLRIPEWYIQKENSLHEHALKLIDEDDFIKWLNERDIRLVLHGHKHIPGIIKIGNISVVACGSSTGKVKTKEKVGTFMSINILKFCANKKIVCQQVAEMINGGGLKILETRLV